jgi:hypothetical protein
LWARQEAETDRVTLAMVTDALRLSGIDLPEDDRKALVDGANTALGRLEELRAVHIPNDVSPPYHFSPVVPGMRVDRTRQPWVMSKAPALKRPANLEAVALWPLRHLAELVRTKQVTSVELTTMYLARLHRHNAVLNNVVTFLDAHGLAEAAQADREIAAEAATRPLHGIPWGCKDIITVKGFPTTWGSPAFTGQQFDYDASIVEMLREAGAVLIAARHRRTGGRRQLVRRADEEPVGSDAGLERLGRTGVGPGRRCGVRHRQRDERSILSPAGRCGRRRAAADASGGEPARRDASRGRRTASGRSAVTPKTARS